LNGKMPEVRGITSGDTKGEYDVEKTVKTLE
jgi:hypothetical protein